MLNEYFKAYEAGGYSPKLLKPEDVEPGTIVVTEEDDNKRLQFARMQVMGTGKKVEVNKNGLLLQQELVLQSSIRSFSFFVYYRTWFRKRNFFCNAKPAKVWATMKPSFQWRQLSTVKSTYGLINTGRENRAISIACILVSNGTSTIKLTTTWIIRLRKLCRATNLIYSIRIL